MSIIHMVGDYEDSKSRGSEDSPSTIINIEDLIKSGEITLEVVLTFFNYGCEIYRRAESIYLISDSKINIEFQYAARAFASYLNAADEAHKMLALLDAFQASRHIVNDSLDLIAAKVKNEIAQSDICKKKSISDDDIVKDYFVYEDILNEADGLIAESRRKRGTFRFQAYLDFLYSEKYKKLCEFLILIGRGVKKLQKQRAVEVDEDRKFVMQLVVAISSVTVAVITLLLTYP